ncbi:hypothetical protein [Pseudonocardia sp. TRM90224]|uniref:hypothetical protein n=1 Tax=Pseudonocardia sp. TRM90224 TaxID=2812678 RepID=UPI001E64718A|nr:hypothetical protein [Pseudonocardia sp. TRM90224]
MVDVLIAIKLRALRRTLHGWTGTAYVLMAVAGLSTALVCVAFMALFPGGITVRVDIAATVFAVWTLGWLFGPVLGASDETLRPENFALLPLRPTALASGLLGASLVGVAPLVTALIMFGLVLVAIPAGIGAVLVAVVAAAGQLALAVLLSRVVFAGLGAALASRRGRDLGVLLGALVGLAYLPIIMLTPHLEPLVVDRTSPLFTAVLHGLPTGWGPGAVAAAAEGRWAVALGLLAALGVLDTLLVVAWSRLLVRRLTTAQPTARSQAAGSRRGALRTVLPDSPLGAVIGKELLLWWRDTRRKALMFSSLLIGILLPVFYTWQNSSLVPLASAGIWIVVFASLQCGNVYGMDGSAVWQTLVAPAAAQVDVRGRQLAWLLIVGPCTLLAVAVLPAVTGTAEWYPWQLAIVAALLGAGSGTFVLASVRAPVPMPTKGGSPFATGPGGTAGKVVNAFAMMGRLLLVVLPPLAVLVAGAITGWSALAWAAVPLGVACGIWAAWRWGGKAAQQVSERGPELLAAVRLPV